MTDPGAIPRGLILSPRDQTISLPTFRVVRTWRPAGLRLATHSHACTNVSLCAAGAFDELVGRRWQRVTPATLIVRPAGEVHANDYSNGASRAIIFELPPAAVRQLAERAPALHSVTCVESAAVAAHVHTLKTELAHPDTVSGLAIEAALLELLVLASRRTEGTESGPRWLDRLADFLEANCTGRFNMRDLEAVTGVHAAHIAKTFRGRHRMTISEHVRGLRVARGARLLRDSDLSLAEVAAECGFYDQSHFSRVFRKHTGVTPRRFRQQKN